jgi:hypothetical protein
LCPDFSDLKDDVDSGVHGLKESNDLFGSAELHDRDETDDGTAEADEGTAVAAPVWLCPNFTTTTCLRLRCAKFVMVLLTAKCV